MTKRLFILLITLIILTSAFVFPSTVSAAEAVYDENGWVPEVGDIDGDGNVATLRDLMCLARYLDDWEGYEDIYVKAADLNGDGLYATLADMYYLERYLAKWSGYTFGVSTEGDAEETTTAGETLPLYARFDFGTNTKAEALNYTTHEWLVSALSYNSNNINVEFTEDSVIVTALRDHGHATTMDPELGEKLVSNRMEFSLAFNDIISYDFNNSLVPGFGSWANAPYVKPSADTRWVGKHQYMQIRMRNFTDNNIISVGYSKAVGSFATTQIASALYLQGGEPATADKNGKTAPIDTDWKVYTYDMNFQSHIGRNLTGSYAEMVESVVSSPNGCGSNNWNWWGNQGVEIVGLHFDFLGGLSRTNLIQSQADYYLCDTREYITAGDKVEVDYVIFGSSIEQLDSYLSYAEESSLGGDEPEYTNQEITTAVTKPENSNFLSIPGGSVTTDFTVLTTEQLRLNVPANVYIPDDLVENVNTITAIMEIVSGMDFEGNPIYSSDLINVEIMKYSDTGRELGGAWASSSGIAISAGDLVKLDALIHESAHALQFKQSPWAYCTWAMESISNYTTYKTQKYIELHYPELIPVVGNGNQTLANMRIDNFDELYKHSMEYWMDNTFEYSGNNNYAIGFALAWFLDEVYGDYTKWITEYEKENPMYLANVNTDALSNEEQLKAFYLAYGEDVFDQFYSWLKQNESAFDYRTIDMSGAEKIQFYPTFAYSNINYHMNAWDTKILYNDLFIDFSAGKAYMTDYKGRNIDGMAMTITSGCVVEFYDAEGELLRIETSTGQAMSLEDVSFVKLVGEGEFYSIDIVGFDAKYY